MDIGRLKTMAEAAAMLDEQLRSLGRAVLRSGGRVSTAAGRAHAESEYEKYKAKLAAIRHKQADETIARIKAARKSLPGREGKA